MCNSLGAGISTVKSTDSLVTRFPYRELASDKYISVCLLTLVLGFSNQAHAEDYFTVANPTLFGNEDTEIPRGITIVDPSVSGAQLNYLSTATSFSDVADGATPLVFDIAAGTTHIKVTGLGGSDNNAINSSDEEYQVISFVVGLNAGTQIRIVF